MPAIIATLGPVDEEEAAEQPGQIGSCSGGEAVLLEFVMLSSSKVPATAVVVEVGTDVVVSCPTTLPVDTVAAAEPAVPAAVVLVTMPLVLLPFVPATPTLVIVLVLLVLPLGVPVPTIDDVGVAVFVVVVVIVVAVDIFAQTRSDVAVGAANSYWDVLSQ